jgi:hypothetical protein
MMRTIRDSGISPLSTTLKYPRRSGSCVIEHDSSFHCPVSFCVCLSSSDGGINKRTGVNISAVSERNGSGDIGGEAHLPSRVQNC